MDEKELDQRIEALANASDKARAQMEIYADVAKLMNLSGVEAKKKILELAGGVDKFNISLKKSAADIKKSMDDLKKSINNGEVSAEELSDQLNTLRDQVNKTSDQSKKQALLEAKADLEAMNARNQANAALKDSLWNMAGVLTVGAANAFKGATTKALSGADAFEIAGSMMTAGVDLVNTANQGGANALKSFGSATAGAGGKMGLAGAAASVLGEGLSAASVGLSELAKAGIGFMLAQTKQLVAGFQTLSSVGAVFNGGMMAMVNTSLRAGMTLEQFSKSISANSANLAKTGLGVADASKKLADSMAVDGKKVRGSLFALGMSMEEQADAFANTMANMAGPSGRLKASNAEVSAQTQEYARNLKMLSDLTGEDMKAKQDQIRQENDTLAFQQQLDGMGETERTNIMESMKGMSEIQRKALRERMIYGTIISADVGIAEATNSGLRKTNEEFASGVRDHSLTLNKTLDIQGRHNGELYRQAMDNKALAMSTNTNAQKAAADQLKTTQLTQKLSTARTDEERKKLMAEMASGAAGTNTGANNLEMLQNNMVEMQTLAVTNMDKFQRALDLSYDAAMAAVRGFNSLATAAANNPIKTGIAALLPAIVGTIAPLILTKIFGGKFGVLGASAANPMHVTSGGFVGPNKPGGNAISKTMSGIASGAAAYLSKLGGASTVMKGVGIGGAAALAGEGIQYGGDKLKEAGHEKTGKAVNVAGTATKYAGYGAMIGSVVPGVGTAIGAGIGGVVGAGKGIYDQYYAGNIGSEKLAKATIKAKAAESTITSTSSSGTLKGVTSDQIKSHPNFKKYLAEEESNFPGSSENYTSAAERVKEDMIKSQGAKIKTSGANQLTAPKPVAGQMTQNLAAEQTKLYGAVVDPAAAAAKAKAMEKPVASANPAEQQQISLLQSILATMQKTNQISSGILQNSY